MLDWYPLAMDLRSKGVSLREVGKQVNRSARSVRDAEDRGWKNRPRSDLHPPELREKARKLKASGFSAAAIHREPEFSHVSVKSIQDWVRSVAFPERPAGRYSRRAEPPRATFITRCRECGSDRGFRHHPACLEQSRPWQRDARGNLIGDTVEIEHCTRVEA